MKLTTIILVVLCYVTRIECLPTYVSPMGPELPEARIVGGYPVSIREHPYQLLLLIDGVANCGASIISQQYAITSAHCTLTSASSITLRSGSSFLYFGGNYHCVQQITIHENFSSSTLDNDIAVLQVWPPFYNQFWNFNAASVQLPEQNQVVVPGTLATVSGWGVQNSNSRSLSFILRAVTVPIVNHTLCENLYPYGQITDAMICAGYPQGGMDACQGDSGGPLVVNNQLIGLVSWGDRCAIPEQPGIYTNVAEYRTWIFNKTGI